MLHEQAVHSAPVVALCAVMGASAEAVVRASLHEVAAGRLDWEEFADQMALISSFHPEVLKPEAIRSIVDLFEEVL